MLKSTKGAYHVTGSTKTQITALISICANGNALPPFVIYPGKTVNASYAVDLPAGSVCYATVMLRLDEHASI